MSARRRSWPAAVAGVALAVSLAGCASETEKYCGALEDQKAELTDLAARSADPDTDVLSETLDAWRELHEQAPDDVADEWQTLVFALEGVVDAFEAAGTTPSEFDPENPPAGVEADDVQRLEDAAAELVSQRVIAAGDGLEQHAKDVCKVDLGLGTSGG